MPSLVTLVWAEAGRWVSANAPTARPSAFNDFDMSISSPLAHMKRRLRPFRSFAIFNCSGARVIATLCHGLVTIHGVDLPRVALVDEIPLQFHGRRQFLVLGRQLALDQEE